MKITCPKCGWKWNYKGKRDYYCSCPNCHASIKLKKLKCQMRGCNKEPKYVFVIDNKRIGYCEDHYSKGVLKNYLRK